MQTITESENFRVELGIEMNGVEAAMFLTGFGLVVIGLSLVDWREESIYGLGKPDMLAPALLGSVLMAVSLVVAAN